MKPTHISCAHCGATNRVPEPRLGDDPVCGRCSKPLLDGQPLELTESNFESVVKNTDLPILVDFWAPWCAPCRMTGPQFEQAARELKGRALLVKINSDDNPKLSVRFRIRSIPTLVRLWHGEEQERISGAHMAREIVKFAQA